MMSRVPGRSLGPSMHEDPPVSITAQRYGGPMQRTQADGITAKHHGRYLVLLLPF
ncbi:hypothetical protein [Streptomyces sp. NPDC057877]|uniref:hypothetical protein n=1 Tax=Streptomyces sp. NPDC057877 TaxID=3346269 RepID=UPI00369B6FE0